MNWHVITVSTSDLGLALGAIGLGGGTVTASIPSESGVTLRYVTRSPSEINLPHGSEGGSPR